jgi:hypothetical protein
MPADLGFAILRAEKLSSKTVIRTRVQHAVRETTVPNADKDRAHLNQILGPKTYADFKTKLDGLLKGVRKFRSDSPEVIELFIGASPQFFKEGGDQNTFFKKSIEWVNSTFGKENVLLGAVHRDESSPHLSIFVCPRIKNPEIAEYEREQAGLPPPPLPKGQKGRRRKAPFAERPPELALSAISYMKGRKSLSSLQTSFWEKAGEPVGLKRGVEGSAAVHTDLNQWSTALARLKDGQLPGIQIPEITAKDILNPKAYIKKVKAIADQALEDARMALAQAKWDKEQMRIEAKRMKNWTDIVDEKSANLNAEIEAYGANVARAGLAQVIEQLETIPVLQGQVAELQAQVDANDADKKRIASEKSMALRALAKTIKNDYSGAKMLELEAALNVAPGKDDIFARLVRSGRAENFEGAVSLVAAYIDQIDTDSGTGGHEEVPPDDVLRMA